MNNITFVRRVEEDAGSEFRLPVCPLLLPVSERDVPHTKQPRLDDPAVLSLVDLV